MEHRLGGVPTPLWSKVDQQNSRRFDCEARIPSPLLAENAWRLIRCGFPAGILVQTARHHTLIDIVKYR